jgi:hypothetical protein
VWSGRTGGPPAADADRYKPLRRIDHEGRRYLVQWVTGDLLVRAPGWQAWLWIDGDWLEVFADVPQPVIEAAEELRGLRA